MFSSVIWLTRVTVTGEGSTKISVQKCDPTWYGNCACGVMSDLGQEEVGLSWFLWFSLNMPILCGFCHFDCILHTIQDSQVEQHLTFLCHSPCGNEIFFLLKPVVEDWSTYPGDYSADLWKQKGHWQLQGLGVTVVLPLLAWFSSVISSRHDESPKVRNDWSGVAQILM